jgi:hypothetical protein
MRILNSLLQFLSGFFKKHWGRPPKHIPEKNSPKKDSVIKGNEIIYSADSIDDLPDVVEDGIIYIIGENGYKWAAAFKCPCGCMSVIQLNLLTGGKNCWNIEFNKSNEVSIKPSINRIRGCRSHFFIINGKVRWDRTTKK